MADGTQAEVDRREDDLLLTEETVGQQPVRAIECPPNFQQTLRRMPPSVARGTITVLGRLAAGEPAAFMGAIRLKACPDILRRRVGIDFRLLFRLLSDRVQVVDLIPRQDLERRIKTLVGESRKLEAGRSQKSEYRSQKLGMVRSRHSPACQPTKLGGLAGEPYRFGRSARRSDPTQDKPVGGGTGCDEKTSQNPRLIFQTV